MSKELENYDEAVRVIKTAILQSQYAAAKSVNEKQLMLYFGIGKYISLNSRKGFWGKGAVDAISVRLDRELPGLKGYSARNLRYMRTFYEEWSYLEEGAIETNDEGGDNLEPAGAKIQTTIWNPWVPKYDGFPFDEFFSIGFSHHRTILTKVKDRDERIFYIKRCALEHYSREALTASINADDYHHQANLPNNFFNTLPAEDQAFRAVNTFKDEYLLDYINVEEAVIRDKQELTERVVENDIVHNIKKFILTFGKGFAFIGNQYHLEAFGVDQYVDLLFFNRKLNCLVAVELKIGKFKTSYLGELQGYLSVLDGFEKMPHENPSIGLILCKDMERSFVDYGLFPRLLSHHHNANMGPVILLLMFSQLEQRGAKRLRSDRPFTVSGIKGILENETYVGDKRLQKQAPQDYLTKKPMDVDYDSYYLKDDHEGVISRELWEQVQNMLEERKKSNKAGVRIGGDHHALFGRVFCAECGSIFRRRTYKNAHGQYKAWNCRERQKGKSGNGCMNKIWKEDELISAIVEELGWDEFDEDRLDGLEIRIDGDKIEVDEKLAKAV